VSGRKFIESVKLFSHLATLAMQKPRHPSGHHHAQQLTAEQEATGVTEDYIRLSVGLEDVRDIVADIDQALRQAAADRTVARRRFCVRPGAVSQVVCTVPCHGFGPDERISSLHASAILVRRQLSRSGFPAVLERVKLNGSRRGWPASPAP